jgi:hypothetical protein
LFGQESLNLLDTRTSFDWKDGHHKRKSRKTNNDLSNRTSSKADYTDQHIVSRTRSKMINIPVNNLNVQNLFFPLHDVIFSRTWKFSSTTFAIRSIEMHG